MNFLVIVVILHYYSENVIEATAYDEFLFRNFLTAVSADITFASFDLIFIGPVLENEDFQKAWTNHHNVAWLNTVESFGKKWEDQVQNGHILILWKLDVNESINEHSESTVLSLLDEGAVMKNRVLLFLLCSEEMINSDRQTPVSSTAIRFLESSSSLTDLRSDCYIVQLKSDWNTSEASSISFEIIERYNIKNRSVSSPLSSFQELERKATRRQNLHGVEIIGVSESKPGLVELNSEGTVSFVGGYNVEEYRYLRDGLNFTYGLQKPNFGATLVGVRHCFNCNGQLALYREATVPWKGYVRLSPSGEVTGMAQQVLRGEADISIQSQEILPYRAQRLTFLIPNLFNIEKLYVFFRQRSASTRISIYAQPFSFEAWIGLFFMATCLVVALFLLRAVAENTGGLKQCSVRRHIVMWTMATICQRGWHSSPRTGSLRIVVFTGLLTFLISYNAFCGTLVSLFSVPSLLINSMDDILKYGFSVFVEKDTVSARDLLRSLKAGRPGTNSTANEIDGLEGLQKILTSESAFISPIYLFYPSIADSANYSTEVMCQNVALEPVDHYPTRSTMFIKKGSPYKELFFYKLIQMAEGGIRHRLAHTYRVNGVRLNCLFETKRLLEPLAFSGIVMPLAILTIGMVVSTLVLILECNKESSKLRLALKHYK